MRREKKSFVKLVVGRLTPDDLACERAILGPWSLVGDSFSEKTLEQLAAFDPPIGSMGEMEKVSDYIVEESRLVLPRLAAELEKCWGESHSIRFWEIVLMPWVVFGLMVLYERERRIESLFEGMEETPDTLELFGVPRNGTSSEDLMEFSVAAKGAELNAVICEWIFRNRAEARENGWPKTVVLAVFDSAADSDKEPALTVSRKKRSLKAWINSMLPVQYIYGMGPLLRIQLSLKLLSFGSRRKRSPDATRASTEEISMEGIVAMKCDPLDFLMEFLPKCYQSATALGKYRHWLLPAHSYLVSTELYFDEGLKYSLAKEVENAGSKVIGVQHGGGYGSTLAHPMLAAVEYKCDKFVSWGWRNHSQYGVSATPLPSPLLSRSVEPCQCCKGRFILVSSIVFFGRIILHTGPSAEHIASEHLQRCRFLDELRSASMLDRICFRPYRQSVGTVSDSSFLVDKYPEVGLLEGGSLHSHLAGCSAVVLDHPGTTLNIAMAWNVPVVGFWSQEYNAVSPEASVHFKRLGDVGIYHETAEQAAEFLIKNGDDIDSWWQSSEVQSARLAWCHEFARHDPEWRSAWRNFVKGLN